MFRTIQANKTYSIPEAIMCLMNKPSFSATLALWLFSPVGSGGGAKQQKPALGTANFCREDWDVENHTPRTDEHPADFRR